MQNFTCCWWLAGRQRTKLKQKGDKCIKVKSFVLQAVRNGCIDIEPAKKKERKKNRPANYMCKDKQSGRVRQYNPKKRCKREFKNLVRAGESGI